jgi:hypothetical protein
MVSMGRKERSLDTKLEESDGIRGERMSSEPQGGEKQISPSQVSVGQFNVGLVSTGGVP